MGLCLENESQDSRCRTTNKENNINNNHNTNNKKKHCDFASDMNMGKVGR